MSFTPYVCMQTNNRCYKSNTKMKPVGILWHSTGANNTSLKRYIQPTQNSTNYAKDINKIGLNAYKNDWNNSSVSTAVHAFIGKFADGSIGTVQCLPWDIQPWGCGKGSKGSCNSGWIQFEICEDNLVDKAYAKKVYDEAIALTVYLCKKYDIDPNKTVTKNGVKIPTITCHNDASKLGFATSHADINHWFPKVLGKSMADVRKDVAAKLSAKTTKSSETTKKVETKTTKSSTKPADFKVKVTANALNVRTGPDKKYKATQIIRKDEVYTIVEEKDGWGKLKSGAGWIMLKYTKKL